MMAKSQSSVVASSERGVAGKLKALLEKLRRSNKADVGGVKLAKAGGYNDYLDPAVLHQFGLNPLIAKLVVEGFIKGLHKSPFHGFSVEFADHREYVPGDDLKYLDWALFARTDTYYIKRFEEETNLRSYILLDRSASMGFGTGRITKWDYACFLASCLGYMMIQQQDAVGLSLFGSDAGIMMPARSRNSHLRQMMRVMIQNPPSGPTSVGASLRSIVRNLKRRGLVVVISDLLDDPEETLKAIKQIRGHKHDVIVFHIQDDAELNFPFRGAALFQDMETGEEIEVDPDSVRKFYIQRREETEEMFRKGLTGYRIDYVPLTTTTPYDRGLSSYLQKRAGLGK
jgi:uncharacterized protein (DUF58 family)